MLSAILAYLPANFAKPNQNEVEQNPEGSSPREQAPDANLEFKADWEELSCPTAIPEDDLGARGKSSTAIILKAGAILAGKAQGPMAMPVLIKLAAKAMSLLEEHSGSHFTLVIHTSCLSLVCS